MSGSSSRFLCVFLAVAGLPAVAPAAEAISAAAVRAPGVAAQPKSNLRYALWELVPLGIDEATANALLDMLRGELEKVVGDRLVLTARGVDPDVRHAVDDCDDKVACLVEATAAFGAHRAIYGVVSNIGNEYNMSLKLLDVRQRQVIATDIAATTE